MMEETKYKELMEVAKNDPYYRQCLEEVSALEPLFLKIRASLPELQQKSLDAYITACEELDHALLMLTNKE